MKGLKKKCFYCNGTCIVDTKHPDRNKFGEFRTKDTAAIYKETLKICKIRKYNLAKRIELRLLLTNDLVAAEARHYITCRKNCQNPFFSKYSRQSNVINKKTLRKLALLWKMIWSSAQFQSSINSCQSQEKNQRLKYILLESHRVT